MDYRYNVEKDIVSKIFYELANYWDEPYQYGHRLHTYKIEIPCWRYPKSKLKSLMMKYNLTLFDFKNDDTIWIEEYKWKLY